MSSWLSPWLQPQQCPSLLVLPLHRVGDKSSASTAIGKFSAVIGSAMLSQQSRVLSPATTTGPGSDDGMVGKRCMNGYLH